MKIMRFIDNNNGTITDTKTNLMWQKSGNGERYTWRIAKDYASNIRLTGYDDWRLPDIEELFTIIDYKKHDPAIDPVFNCKSDYYWSGSTKVYPDHYAWIVGFGTGYVDEYRKDHFYFVRCVRTI